MTRISRFIKNSFWAIRLKLVISVTFFNLTTELLPQTQGTKASLKEMVVILNAKITFTPLPDNLSLPSQPVITRLVICYLPLSGLAPIARERRWLAAEFLKISQVVRTLLITKTLCGEILWNNSLPECWSFIWNLFKHGVFDLIKSISILNSKVKQDSLWGRSLTNLFGERSSFRLHCIATSWLNGNSAIWY